MTTRDDAYGVSGRQYAATAATTATPAQTPSGARTAPGGSSQSPPQPTSASPMQPDVTQPAPSSTLPAAPGRAVTTGPRRVRLTVARVDPWSVMKLSFLLAVAVGIALVVSVGVLWTTLNSMGVFASVNSTIGDVLGESGTTFNLMDYIGFTRVLSLATVIAVVDVFLLTALATLGAFLYNMCSTLVGGLHVTLTDD